jgi:hypothetical protein
MYGRLGTKVRQGRRRAKIKNFIKRRNRCEKQKRRKTVRCVPGEKNLIKMQQRNMLILMYKQERKQTYECWKGKGRGERTALEKKGRAGSWQNCNLCPPAGWKGLFYLILVSIRACNTSSPKYKAEKA